MLITKQSCFRHILSSICLIMILIVGTGIASAVDIPTPSKPIVRWMDEDRPLVQDVLFANTADPVDAMVNSASGAAFTMDKHRYSK